MRFACSCCNPKYLDCIGFLKSDNTFFGLFTSREFKKIGDFRQCDKKERFGGVICFRVPLIWSENW